MTTTTAPAKAAAAADLAQLFQDLMEYFDRELILMEGNYGLTGEETDEEVAELDPGDEVALAEMRTAKNFRRRIEAAAAC
ncbi:hypothetical protein [Defluviimonas salinarum]|uniref:Uncharacterized protein n=1 Tax=Defluviimonas salinarum TaxID=2992147 RepID=A0ABT3J9D6_9RHOB|nr:hypothetical protein [Defluviimonas salinarum]MCW3784296.1 hypothetical protein [Defluviimonas salinarum]